MTSKIMTPAQPEWEMFYLAFTTCFNAEQGGNYCDCNSGNRRHTHETLKLFPGFSLLRTMQYLQYHGGTCDCRVHDTVTRIEATRELYLKQAAEKGDIAAQVEFALLCLNGTLALTMGERERSFEREGMAWLKNAAAQGSARAALILKGRKHAGNRKGRNVSKKQSPCR